jgi:hypothetical protein
MHLLALAVVLGGGHWSRAAGGWPGGAALLEGAAGGWPGGAALLEGAAGLSAWSHFLLDRSDS